MLLLYIPTVLIVLYYGLYYYFTRNFNYWKKRNVVGPKPVALFGNFKDLAFRRKYIGTVVREIYNSYPKEKYVGIYRMTTPSLIIRDLDLVKHILVRDFDMFKDRTAELGKTGLARNLFHTEGESWSILRSWFNPLFTPGKLKNMFNLMNERCDNFIKNLEIQCKANSVCEVYTTNQKYTVSTIFSCAFGIDIDPFDSKNAETFAILDQLGVRPTYAIEIDMMYPGIFSKLNMTYFPKEITTFFESLVTNIMTQRNGKPSSRNDFMDLIINMRQTGQISSTYNLKQDDANNSLAITDDIIAAQAFVFYLGGYETSATTMTYLLYNIAIRPEIQDKLRNEIDTVTKAHNGEINYESLNEMKYLEQTILETLRMYSLIDPLQRRAKADYKIPETDVIIKKNQIVLIPVLGIHYDEKHYPNPGVFDPDRFSPELVRARHPCAFLPFGVGPRNCIGLRFGSLQSRLGIAKILSKFKIETCSATKIPLENDPNRVILGPKPGVFLNFISRDT